LGGGTGGKDTPGWSWIGWKGNIEMDLNGTCRGVGRGLDWSGPFEYGNEISGFRNLGEFQF